MALQRAIAQVPLEIHEFALRAADFEGFAFNDRDSGRVITTILEATQAIYQNIDCSMLTPHISNDSTHICSP
jgi:hypothetical protein